MSGPDLSAFPLRLALLNTCRQILEARMAVADAAMRAAQESANAETKSSAGDKYETGRAMAQNERDRNAAHRAETQGLVQELNRLDPAIACDTVRFGALVRTSAGNFFVSTSAGRLPPVPEATVDEWLAISTASPIARALAGHRAGDEVAFNGRAVRVLAVA